MSSRVTRSSARLAADSSSAAVPPVDTAQPPPASRKRKASAHQDIPSDELQAPVKVTPSKRAKRQKVTATEPPAPTVPRTRGKKTQQPVAMSAPR